MPLDRSLQRQILEKLREAFPNNIHLAGNLEAPDGDLAFNAAYLIGHGLIEGGLSHDANGTAWLDQQSYITAKGLDFLEGDGGLSAILGIMTVKLHADTIREMISAQVEASTLTVEKKRAIMAQISALPSVALQAGISDLVRRGIQHLPDVSVWLQTLHGL